MSKPASPWPKGHGVITPVIGIVGGIGAGKSAVAYELVKFGGKLIAADPFGHDALRQPEIMAQAKQRWGDAIFHDDGTISRRALGKIVFADGQELKYLESLVFPYIDRRIEEEIVVGRSEPKTAFLILDAAILFETGWNRRCDKVLFVDVPREIRLDRLQKTRGWDEVELTRREANQHPVEEKHRRADAGVDNAGERAKLAPAVEKILREWGWRRD